MPSSTPAVPIIIRRTKARRHGHHGGAWKVAYADFVTAMMALFIVLWLLSSSESVRKSIAGYFRDPTGTGTEKGGAVAGAGEGLTLRREDMEKLRDKIEAAFRKVPEFQSALKDKVQMTVTGEGLRIEFLETEKGLFFESGSASPTDNGRELLASLAREAGKIQSGILIEGHTDSRPFSGAAGYTNWELSADRANAARRLMEASGLRSHQVTQVRGYADQKLRDRQDPENASNRRISVVIQYDSLAKGASEAPALPSGAGTPSRHP